MASYRITYSCGHTSKVNIIGPSSSREWKLAHLQAQVCFDCYKQQRLQAALAETQERELPPLVGSAAQIDWATSIRLEILDKLEDLETTSPEQEQLTLLAIDTLCKETSAHQWIEWRDWPVSLILQRIERTLLAAPTQAQVIQRQEEELARVRARALALAEATLRPPEPLTETLAEITFTAKSVHVRFPENREDFNEVVRRLDYAWNRESYRWERELCTDRTGPARDRAVELGHTLLSRRFCVCTFDPELRAAIIAGAFEPEQTRWITVMVAGEYAGWFVLQWGSREDYYEVARRIPLSRYHKPFVVVSPSSYDKLLDFAERYAFRLTSRAQDIIDQAQEQRRAMLVVKKETPLPREPIHVASTVPPVLAVPQHVEIAEEFSDEDDD